MRLRLRFKSASFFFTDNGQTQDCPSCSLFIFIKTSLPQYLDNALIDFEEKSPLNDFERTHPSAEKYGCK